MRTNQRPCLDRVAAERPISADLSTSPATEHLCYIGHLLIAG